MGIQFLITTGNADTLDEGQVVFGEIGEGLEDILAKAGFKVNFPKNKN